MKKYKIEWETDFCEDFSEKSGTTLIEAENEEKAIKKFYKSNPLFTCVVIMRIEVIK